MIDALSTILIVLSAALSVWILVYIVRDRTMDNPLLLGLVALEVGLIVQLVVGIALLITTDDTDVNRLSFLGYLFGILLLLPAGVLWSQGEKSRSGTAVLLVATMVVPVLILRLVQLWG